MKIQIGLVDISGLPPWPHAFVATQQVRMAADPQWGMRMAMDRVLAPARIQVATLRHGSLIMLTVVNQGD
jgi:hypothetical protein